MSSKVILKKQYSWESLLDIEEDILYAVNEKIPNGSDDFPGTVTVTVEYDEEEAND